MTNRINPNAASVLGASVHVAANNVPFVRTWACPGFLSKKPSRSQLARQSFSLRTVRALLSLEQMTAVTKGTDAIDKNRLLTPHGLTSPIIEEHVCVQDGVERTGRFNLTDAITVSRLSIQNPSTICGTGA